MASDFAVVIIGGGAAGLACAPIAGSADAFPIAVSLSLSLSLPIDRFKACIGCDPERVGSSA